MSNGLTLATNKDVKKNILLRKDMDVTEHERLSNITLRYNLK